MNSKTYVRSVLRGAAVLAMTGALAFACAGCTTGSSTQKSTASDSTTISGNMDGAYKTPEYTWADNSSYQTKTPSASEISQIYTFTLNGKTYTLPCKASELADAGWAPVRDTTVAAKFCSKASIGNGYALNGDTSKQVGLNVLNTTDSEANWQDCTVVGVLVDGNSNVDFATAAGIKVGSTYGEVQKAYGATSYDYDQFGTMGFHFAVASDSSKSGNRWYGQCVDTLSVTPDNASLYPNWSSDSVVYTLRLENFGDIAASE